MQDEILYLRHTHVQVQCDTLIVESIVISVTLTVRSIVGLRCSHPVLMYMGCNNIQREIPF